MKTEKLKIDIHVGLNNLYIFKSPHEEAEKEIKKRFRNCKETK